jgi:hypothetical protein
MEINTLPGLNPVISDICIMAETEGLAYNHLINEILYLAAERYEKEGKVLERLNINTAYPIYQTIPVTSVKSDWKANNAS